MRTNKAVIGLLLLGLTPSLPGLAKTEDFKTCNLAGKLRAITYQVLGKERALNQSSFGISIISRDKGEVLCDDYMQGGQNIYPASTIKTLVALAALRRVDRGEIKLTDMITIDQSNAAGECSDWDCSIYGPGKKLTLAQILSDCMIVSNNLAANQLIDIAGKDFINQTADFLGAQSVHVYRKVYNNVDAEPNNPKRNTATAEGFVQLFREIATGRLSVLSQSSRAFLIDLLRHQKYHDSLNAQWPTDPTFYHKTGATSHATADTGFFYVGTKKDKVAIIVGLQNFAGFQMCDHCPTLSGYDSLSAIGAEALKIARTSRVHH